MTSINERICVLRHVRYILYMRIGATAKQIKEQRSSNQIKTSEHHAKRPRISEARCCLRAASIRWWGCRTWEDNSHTYKCPRTNVSMRLGVWDMMRISQRCDLWPETKETGIRGLWAYLKRGQITPEGYLGLPRRLIPCWSAGLLVWSRDETSYVWARESSHEFWGTPRTFHLVKRKWNNSAPMNLSKTMFCLLNPRKSGLRHVFPLWRRIGNEPCVRGASPRGPVPPGHKEVQPLPVHLATVRCYVHHDSGWAKG